MIIKREYATFGALYKDELTKNEIKRAIKESMPSTSDNDIDLMLDYVREVIFNQADLGCGIPGDAYQKMKEVFVELDRKTPFDNGLDYRDVTKVITFPSRKGNAMTQWLIRGETSDYCNEIVQVIAFEKKGLSIIPIEPWFPGIVHF